MSIIPTNQISDWLRAQGVPEFELPPNFTDVDIAWHDNGGTYVPVSTPHDTSARFFYVAGEFLADMTPDILAENSGGVILLNSFHFGGLHFRIVEWHPVSNMYTAEIIKEGVASDR